VWVAVRFSIHEQKLTFSPVAGNAEKKHLATMACRSQHLQVALDDTAPNNTQNIKEATGGANVKPAHFLAAQDSRFLAHMTHYGDHVWVSFVA